MVRDSAASAGGDSGVISALGGGVFAAGQLTMIDSTVQSNSVDATAGEFGQGNVSSLASGAGVFATGASEVHIVRSTIAGNVARADAGAGTGGSFAVGAGIHVGNGGGNQAEIVTSTISGNTAQTASNPGAPSSGGGIFSVAGLETVLSSDTITGNSAAVGANVSGGGFFLSNTLLSAPTGGGTNCNAAQTSVGFNLESANSCGLNQPTDQINVGTTGLDPNLASNGGPTQTHALLNTSPAVDAGKSFGGNADQRELPRPVDFFGIPDVIGGDGTDIGAFEIQKACPSQFVPGGPCAPEMETAPLSLGFGSLIVGSGSAPQSITVTNTGTTDLILGAVTIAGPDPGDFAKASDSCSSATVAPSGSCSIEIQFEPKAAGARTGAVIVSGNAPGHETDTVSLSGTGLVAATGERAAAKQRCRKKFEKGTEKRKQCLKDAKRKPV
jgi:hypothetical protein